MNQNEIKDKVNLNKKFASFDEVWVPKVIGEINDQYVKAVKFEGEYIWHLHKHEDELFLVIDGHIDLQLRDRTVPLDAGEFFIVPRGVEHRPVAEKVASVLLFEPKSTRNTGSENHRYTIEAENLDEI